MKLVFLSSGAEALQKAFHHLIENKITDVIPSESKIYIIGDRKCGATEWSTSQKLPSKIIELSNDEGWEALLHETWMKESDFIITTIYKVIPIRLLEEYQNKMINIHYSILPAFQGKIGSKTISTSIEYGSKLFGATCHQVTSQLDAGPPICQVAYASPTSNIEELSYLCFLSGCVSLFNALASKNKKTTFNRSTGNAIRHKETDYIVNPCHKETETVLNFFGEQTYL